MRVARDRFKFEVLNERACEIMTRERRRIMNQQHAFLDKSGAHTGPHEFQPVIQAKLPLPREFFLYRLTKRQPMRRHTRVIRQAELASSARIRELLQSVAGSLRHPTPTLGDLKWPSNPSCSTILVRSHASSCNGIEDINIFQMHQCNATRQSYASERADYVNFFDGTV